MPAWGNFFFAEVSASAALAGLIFVGMSINLTKILALNVMPNRGAQALMLLLTSVIAGSLMLVPDQWTIVYGAEVLGVGVLLWIALTNIDRRAYLSAPAKSRRLVIGNTVLNQLATLAFVVGGVAIILRGEQGVYWLVPAFIFTFIKAMTDAWVLLVEINR